MPSMYAHYHFGGKVFKALPKSARDIINKNRELYLIGLQGPDILFYYKPLGKNRVNGYGYGMHDRPAAEFFRGAAERYESCGKDEAMLPYLLGFICHFALDSTCDGYIEKKIETDGVCHTEIEAEFDRYLLEKEGLDPLSYRTSRTIAATKENAFVISKCFDGIFAADAYKAIKSMAFYSDVLVAPGKVKRSILFAGLKAAGKFNPMRYMILNSEPAPECADSCLRLSKLMDKKAVDLAVRLSENYLGYLKGENDLDPWFGETFGPGENWRDIKVCALEEEKTYEV